MNYQEAWDWLEERGGGLYSSTQTAEGRWQCTVGGAKAMPELRCTGHGQRHDEALLNAVQELYGLLRDLAGGRERLAVAPVAAHQGSLAPSDGRSGRPAAIALRERV